jgi:hypothetical protein
MKTILNDILATILAVVFSTAMINSNTALMVGRNTSDMYAAAVNAEVYQSISPAFENGQPIYF